MDLFGLALLLAIGLLALYLALVVHVVFMLMRPRRRGFAFAVARGQAIDPSHVVTLGGTPLTYQSWSFRSRGIDLPVWDVPGAVADGPIVVFSHGWSESRTLALARVPALHSVASRVVLWDLPGHGDADGTCNQGVSEAQDLSRLVALIKSTSPPPELAYDRAETGEVCPQSPVILYGHSLGAGISIEVAATVEGVSGIIAESPYRLPATPARGVLKLRNLPCGLTLRVAIGIIGLLCKRGVSWFRASNAGGFDRARLAARIACPLLVVHGSDDQISPIQDGRDIVRAATGSPQATLAEIEGGGHTDLWYDHRFRPKAEQAVGEFLRAFRRDAAAHSADHRVSVDCG